MASNQKGTLNYKVKAVKVANDVTGKKKYVAHAVSKGIVSFEDFVTHIAEHGSPFSRGTIHGVLTDALDCLQEKILNGECVRLGELGLFSVGIDGKSADKLEDWSVSQNVTGVHLLVRNTKSWSNSQLRNRCRLVEAGTYVAGGSTKDESTATDENAED